MAEDPSEDDKRPKRSRDLKYNTPILNIPDYPPDYPDGSAGVREPRRPLPVAGSGVAADEL